MLGGVFVASTQGEQDVEMIRPLLKHQPVMIDLTMMVEAESPAATQHGYLV